MGILCVLIEATLTPIQGFLNFFLNIFGIENASFVNDILGLFNC